MYDEKTGMDISKDKDWFFFMAKIRPWLGMVLSSLYLLNLLSAAIDGDYTSLLLVIASIVFLSASLVVDILVFVKSSRHYGKFVRFMKFALLYEVACVAVVRFGQPDWIILVAVWYFLWYKLNMKYFENRLSPYSDMEKGRA